LYKTTTKQKMADLKSRFKLSKDEERRYNEITGYLRRCSDKELECLELSLKDKEIDYEHLGHFLDIWTLAISALTLICSFVLNQYNISFFIGVSTSCFIFIFGFLGIYEYKKSKLKKIKYLLNCLEKVRNKRKQKIDLKKLICI